MNGNNAEDPEERDAICKSGVTGEGRQRMRSIIVGDGVSKVGLLGDVSEARAELKASKRGGK